MVLVASYWQNALLWHRSYHAPHPRPGNRFALSAALVSIVLLASFGLGPASAQDASQSPQASLAAVAAPLPDGFDSKMVKKVGQIIGGVHPVRGLPPAEDVAYRVIDSQAFRSELRALFRAEYSDAAVQAEDAAFTRLGLLGPDDDLEELILAIYDSQVLAYYDPLTKTFSLIGPIDKIGALESIVVAHEYDHALQDAQWDLEGQRIDDLDRSDAILAQQALIEGDATAVMYDWATRELKLTDLLRVAAQSLTKQDQKTLSRMPMILQRQLEFPISTVTRM